MEARQARFRWLDLESVISERRLQHSRQLVRSRWRDVQQEETITFDVRKQAQEILLRDQQLALKKAILQSRDDPEPRLVQHQLLAELQVQRIGHGVGIGDGRNDWVGRLRFEQEPGVCRPGHRILELELSAPEKGRRRRQNPRIARLVEIQTTGVISGPQAEGDELDSFERRNV